MTTPRTTFERIDAAREELAAATNRWRDASVRVDNLKKQIADATEGLRAQLLQAEFDAKRAKDEVAVCCRRLEGA